MSSKPKRSLGELKCCALSARHFSSIVYEGSQWDRHPQVTSVTSIGVDDRLLAEDQAIRSSDIRGAEVMDGIVPEDFRRFAMDGARFEALVCQLLQAMGYRILEKPAIGTEGGRDVLVERTLRDAMGQRSERVVVQCKHRAHAGRPIGDAQIGVWQNAMARYQACGYLLVTDTRVTENLSKSFREYSNNQANFPRWAAFWDVDEVVSHLNKYPDVRDSFFPAARTVFTPLYDLVDEVRTWLEAIRYDVTDPQHLPDGSIAMLAAFKEGSIKQEVSVRCIGGQITTAHMDEMDAQLDRRVPQAWLISDKRISEGARRRSREHTNVRAFRLSDFLREMIWAKYFDSLQDLVEREKIPQLYIDPGCYRLDVDAQGRVIGRETSTSLDLSMDEWLWERGKTHISLLGEFGAGKTWFCRHYAHRQLQRFLKDPARERLPVLITLRLFAKAMTAQQMINDTLLEQYRLPFVGSAYEVFREMNSRGKLLVILDGFDEMARQVDYQTVVDNFWELAKLADEGSKVILTSRTEYFRWAKESEKIFHGEVEGRRTIVLERPKFEVLHLEPFNNDQIQEVILRRLGSQRGGLVARQILRSQYLADMARKPVLIELLLAALDEVSAETLGSRAHVYLHATHRLLLRNITAEKTFTSTADKLYFLCELAWEMVKSNELRIHYTLIPDRIGAYFGDRIKDQHELDNWDFDLRAQTLLHRDAAGYYEFAHKSLAEYFVALKFAAELGCLGAPFRATYSEADGRPCAIPIKRKSLSGLKETFGAIAFSDMRMRAVHELMPGLMAEDSRGMLWEAINETKGRTSEEVGYTGGNAATLLMARGESLAGRDLSKTVLNSVGLSECNLRLTDFRGAVLHGSCLQRADLRGSDLTDATLDEASLVSADLRGAKGLDRRFFRFASQSIPRLEYIRGRSHEVEVLTEFLGAASRPSVAVIVGPPGAGKSCLLASIAHRYAGTLEGKPTFWYQGDVTVKLGPRFDFYSVLAAFMTVGGHDSLAGLVANHKDLFTNRLLDDMTSSLFPEVDSSADPNEAKYAEALQEARSQLLAVFQKESWLVCIDDVFPDRGYERFADVLRFLAAGDLSTRIVVTAQSIAPELRQDALVLEIEAIHRAE
jgi:hypothetical protein